MSQLLNLKLSPELIVKLNLRWPLKIFIIVAAIFSQACTSTTPVSVAPESPTVYSIVTPEYSTHFGEPPKIESPQEIHHLTDAQKQTLLIYMNARNPNFQKPYERLFQYIDKELSNYDYEPITMSAAQALEERRGNCMTLAVITTALARVAGVDIGYQLMDDSPVYERTDNVINRGLHIRTKLYDLNQHRDPNSFSFYQAGLYIDYFPTGSNRFINNMDENEYLSMYYRNVAVEKLTQNNLNDSFWYAMEALKYEPMDAEVINLLAVVSRRAHFHDTAESLYQFGIANSGEKLSLLKNYYSLLILIGRTEEAATIEDRINKIDDPSPFNWIRLAKSAYDEGDYRQAIRYYDKAVKVAPYLHEGYAGLAFSYYRLGNLKKAEKNLTKALEIAYSKSIRNLYEAKLAVLQKEVG